MAWDAIGTASVLNSGTTVTTTADFRANFIEVGKGFQFPTDTRGYQITAINERAGTFTISPAYEGVTKVSQPFWVQPYLGVAQAAERALREATDAFTAVQNAAPFDNTPGRLVRVGDFGAHGFTTLLSAENDLNDVIIPGLYSWLGSSIPANAPLATGAHMMMVSEGRPNAIRQDVWRHTISTASMIDWTRNVFPVAPDAPVFTASRWARTYNSSNILGIPTFVSGAPTGGLFQLGGDDAAPYWWRGERYANGVQVIRFETLINCAATSSQPFTLPVGWNFVSGGKTFASYSYVDTAPNAALAANNVTVVGYNSSTFVRLAVAGTMPGSPTDKERLRIRVEGRWATMLNT